MVELSLQGMGDMIVWGIVPNSVPILSSAAQFL
jgi:hypothetical protein